MARPLWKGRISFGLVNIPTALYSAEKREDLDFKMFDRRNMAQVGFRRYNKETGEEVPWSDVVKGYEYEDEKYVMLAQEDFREADVKATEMIEILSFASQQEIDPMFYETPYYIVPQKGGEKGYILLRDALRQSGRVGISYIVLSNRQHVAAVIPHGDLLILELLRFNYELRDAGGLSVPQPDTLRSVIKPKELEMAEQLIVEMAEPWTPEQYHDEYREDLLKMIQRKVETGQARRVGEPSQAGEQTAGPEVVDMLTLLKASIEKAGRKESERAPAAADRARGKRQRAAPSHEKKRKSA